MIFLMKDAALIGPFNSDIEAKKHLELMYKYSGQSKASLSKFIIVSPSAPYNYKDNGDNK